MMATHPPKPGYPGMPPLEDEPCRIGAAPVIECERAAVVAEAITWLGTPYHHMGRVKGAGADCLTFLAGAFEAAGLVPRIEIPYYPADWHMHRAEELYLGGLLQHCIELAKGAAPLPGDICLWRSAAASRMAPWSRSGRA